MTNQKFTPAYPAELRERGVRLFREHRGDYASDNAAYKAIAPKLGCSPDSLRAWCQQAERDAGQRGGLTSAEKDQNSKIRRAVRTHGHFPSEEAAAKLIYLALNATSAEWKRSVREWYAVRCQLAIMFDDRFPMA